MIKKYSGLLDTSEWRERDAIMNLHEKAYSVGTPCTGELREVVKTNSEQEWAQPLFIPLCME